MFWLLLGHSASIFLSNNFSTTLEFNTPIEQVIYGGSKSDLFTYLSLNKKTLTLKPLVQSVNSNLTIITKGRNYTFWLKMDPIKPHVYIRILDGGINSSFKTVYEDENLMIQEGSSSALIRNKGRIPLDINGALVEGQGNFSKGIPIIVNGKRIFN